MNYNAQNQILHLIQNDPSLTEFPDHIYNGLICNFYQIQILSHEIEKFADLDYATNIKQYKKNVQLVFFASLGVMLLIDALIVYLIYKTLLINKSVIRMFKFVKKYEAYLEAKDIKLQLDRIVNAYHFWLEDYHFSLDQKDQILIDQNNDKQNIAK